MEFYKMVTVIQQISKKAPQVRLQHHTRVLLYEHIYLPSTFKIILMISLYYNTSGKYNLKIFYQLLYPAMIEFILK